MSRPDTISLVPPGWDGSGPKIEIHQFLKRFFWVAEELWKLTGDDARAAAIGEVLDAAYEREPVLLTTEDVDRMLQLLEGLPEAFVGTIVDEEWRLRPEQLPELRARTKTLDLDERRGDLALAAVGEALSNVGALENVLRKAQKRHLWVSFD